MSDIAAIHARIQIQMQAVPRIGNVYTSRQLVWDQAGLADVATYHDEVLNADVMRFWHMRAALPTSKWADASGRKEWWRQVLIEGHLQWANAEDGSASELLATSLAEQVILALANDGHFTKLGGTVLDVQVPKLVTNEPQVFAGFMVMHAIAIDFRVLTIEA